MTITSKQRVVQRLSKEAGIASFAGRKVGRGTVVPQFVTNMVTDFGRSRAIASAKRDAMAMGLSPKKTEKYINNAREAYESQREIFDESLFDRRNLAKAEAKAERKAAKAAEKAQQEAEERAKEEAARQEASSNFNKAVGATLLGGAGVVGGGLYLRNKRKTKEQNNA